MTPTIYALSSGRPPAGIAVVRISGPSASGTLTRLTGRALPPLRRATLRILSDPADGVVIDRALVVRFAAPASVTGDDLVELHLHGGVAVVAALLRTLAAEPGLALAARGAFTRRAFDNGKLDLSQAEGLADLIEAETDAQRLQALGQAGGRLRTEVEAWRATLISLLADVEARLDFAEAETDVADRLDRFAHDRIDALRRSLAAALADSARGERLRDGLTVAVTGPPNAGKSSLINALARRDVAIVAATPGTTRDIIEVRLDLGGVAVTLVDTAGLRRSDDPVEREGIARGRTRAAAADLVLVLGAADPDGRGQLVVTKIDLSGAAGGLRGGILHVSAMTGEGIAALENWLTDWARTAVRPGEPALFTRERHRIALLAASAALDVIGDDDLVLCAEHLRHAALALASITGRIGAEDILDGIFARFCVGK